MTDLIHENGEVKGVIASQNNETIKIRANKGVILASGGFEKNQTLREKYLPKPTDKAWSAANIHNTGDAFSATEDLNVALHQMDAGGGLQL